MTATTRPETDALVKARVLELLESWRPWHRRLWDLGTVLAMREVIEAADWVGQATTGNGPGAWSTGWLRTRPARQATCPLSSRSSACRDS